jgi:hypothetical protein
LPRRYSLLTLSTTLLVRLGLQLSGAPGDKRFHGQRPLRAGRLMRSRPERSRDRPPTSHRPPRLFRRLRQLYRRGGAGTESGQQPCFDAATTQP